MPISLRFYRDAQLTQSLDTTVLSLDRAIGGPAVDAVVYLGSINPSSQFSGFDDGPILVTVRDADPYNDGFTPTDFVLATTQSGLDTATGTLAINGGINGGVANAVPIWIRFKGEAQNPKTSTDLFLTTNAVKEMVAP